MYPNDPAAREEYWANTHQADVSRLFGKGKE
jgi:hypothetical protein